MIPEGLRTVLIDAVDEDNATADTADSRGESGCRMIACSVGEPFVTVVV